MKIAVMGSGGWGTALALVLLENGHDVTLWSYREEESAILREKRENPMLKGVPLPDGLALTSDRECVKNCKVVVLATPSFAVRTTARAVASLLEPSAVLVSVSKGIEKDTSLTLTDAIAQEVGEGHPSRGPFRPFPRRGGGPVASPLWWCPPLETRRRRSWCQDLLYE